MLVPIEIDTVDKVVRLEGNYKGKDGMRRGEEKREEKRRDEKRGGEKRS